MIYFLREVATNIKRSPLMSIASVTTVMVLTIIVGSFILLVQNLNSLSQALVSEIQVIAYLEDGVDRRDITGIQRQMTAVKGVKGAHFISKETAFHQLIERMKGRIEIDDISTNPLPDSFEIDVSNPDQIRHIAEQIETIPQVEKVKYGEEIAQRMLALNRLVHIAGIVVIIALLFSTLFIVSNTIRLTVFARRQEIEIMKLVGAADWFIRWPFIIEGIFQGLLGAFISALLLSYSYHLVIPKIAETVPFIPVLLPNELLPSLFGQLLLIGAIVGALGSLFSVNKFLKL